MKMRWRTRWELRYVESDDYVEIEARLKKRWEPFAVSNDLVWFRRTVTERIPKDEQ